MNEPVEPSSPAPSPAVPPPAGDSLAGLDAQALLRQGIDPAAPTAGPAAPPRWQAPTPAELSALLPGLEVQELIGQGGMGAVYRARQLHLDRSVALKILPKELGADPDFAARFAREARALARLNHPNLVTIHDYGQSGGWCWLLMEYVDGANLRQVMRTGRLSARQALAIVPQLCDALQYAHDEGVVHRDIKPENILMDARGRVRIADFGLAKLRSADGGAGQTLTGSGAVLGTVHYMAPEQVEGAKGVDHRADIYSLGVVFYEMLTGGLPLGRFDPPSRRIEIDVRLDEVVLKTLAKDPDLRYQQAAQVQTAVEEVQAAPATGPALEASKDGSGVRIGGLEIDDKGVRFGDTFAIDDKGVRIAGRSIGARDGRVEVVADDDRARGNRFISEAIFLIMVSAVQFLIACGQIGGRDLSGPPWLVAACALSAPLVFFGACCLQLRLLPTWAGIACYAACLPALWCWYHSWWLGIIAGIFAIWLTSSVGGRRWDRHFTVKVPHGRLLAVLLALIGLIALSFAASRLWGGHGGRSASRPDSGWSWDGGPGKAMIERIYQAERLPRTRVFTASLLVRWEGVEGVAAIEMWVEMQDGSSYFSRRNLAPAPASGDPLWDPSWDAGNSRGWQEIRLPFDARASRSPITALRFDALLPGKGRVEVRTPILVVDAEAGAAGKPSTGRSSTAAEVEVLPNPYRGLWAGRENGEAVTIAIEGDGRLLINGSKAAAWSLDGGRLSVTDHRQGGAPITGFIDGQGRLVLVDELGKALVLRRETDAQPGRSASAGQIP